MIEEEKSYALKQMHDRNLYLNKQIKKKDKEIERLNNKIDKAIELIYTHFERDSTGVLYQKYTFDRNNIEELLKILQGSDKE